MSARQLAFLLALAALVVPAAAMAQGLGDAAAREREGRQKAEKRPEATPVFTNDDLDARRPPGREDDSDEEAESAARSSPSPPERRERYERRDADVAPQTDQVNRAQAEVDVIERRIRELNGRLNPMSRDYVYGEARTGDAAGEESRIKSELSELEGRLVGARQDLARAQEGLSAAREQRRGRPSAEGGH